MKFSYKKKRYIWKPTAWQKTLVLCIFAGSIFAAFYFGWIYEQIITSGSPWIGGY